MKRFLKVFVALALVTPVLAQNGNGGTASGTNTLDELWSFQDATPLDTGAVDLRFSFGWQTGLAPGGTGDNFIVTPSLVWGFTEDWELSVGVPVYVGDGGDRYVFEDGQADTKLGLLWQLSAQGDGGWLDAYDVALAGNFRIPTGCGSDGVDYEGRFILTHNYDDGMRAHFNLWGKVVNGTNNQTRGDHLDLGVSLELLSAELGLGLLGDDGVEERNFQYGTVIGVDFELCDGVRGVLDYVYRSSMLNGQGGSNLAEIGWEWDMSDSDRLGMSVQFNLDRSNGEANAGAIITYAHALTY